MNGVRANRRHLTPLVVEKKSSDYIMSGRRGRNTVTFKFLGPGKEIVSERKNRKFRKPGHGWWLCRPRAAELLIMESFPI